MTSIHSFLKNLGFSEKEISIYITLFQLGPQAASIIAKRVKLPRSSAFFQLERLVSRGFVKKQIRASVQFFSAVSPEEVKQLLTRQQQRVSYQLESLERLLPEFSALSPSFLSESKVTYFEGIEGICKMIDLLTKDDQPLYFISAHRFHPEVTEYIMKSYVPKRQKMKNKAQMIIADSKRARVYVKLAKGVYDWVRFVDADKAGFESTIAIYGHCIQLLSTDPHDLTGVLIENRYLAKTMKSVFDLMKLSMLRD